MRLLGNSHSRARMTRAELDDTRECGRFHNAVVGGEAFHQSLEPVLGGNRTQRVEASKAAECPLVGCEQVPHYVLDAAGEQIADARALLKDGAHPLRHNVWMPEGSTLACKLLKLVKEQNQTPAIGRRDSLGQLEREVEGAMRVLRRPAGRYRQFDRVAELALKLEHRGRLRRGQRRASKLACPAHDAPCGRAICDHRQDESLRKLGSVGDPEQVHARRVAPTPARPVKRSFADARFASSTRASQDQVRRPQQRCRDLSHVLLSADHLARWDRRIGREQVSAGLAHGSMLPPVTTISE